MFIPTFTRGLFLSAFVFPLFALVLSAQPTTTPQLTTPAPVGPVTEITFEEPVHDFGTVLEGEIVTQVYTFTNTGDEPLVFTNARGSCGCTVPEWPREPIQPGETASLTVEFNSKNKRGKRNQKVTLTANTNPPRTFIYLTGEIIPATPEITIGDDFVEVERAAVEPAKDCFVIYPNPTAELLKLETLAEDVGKRAVVAIYGPTGQLMARREIVAIEGSVIEFGVGHYPAGNYVAQVRIGDRRPESRCFVVTD